MNLTINDKILKKYNLSLDEFMLLYLCANNEKVSTIASSLIEKQIAEPNLTNTGLVVVSDNTKEIVSSIIIDSDKSVIEKDQEYLDVAHKMRDLFPEGRKPGTTYYWRDSDAIIAKKLKTLTVKFNFKFTEDEALEATQKYIESFNGDYKYMQLLKYFILKTDLSSGEVRSEFMSLIENKDQVSSLNDNWLNEIR